MRDRLRLAVPNKGRLKEPTLELLHAAGLRFEVGERNLLARVANLALDLLFVRVDDVGEFVADGVADLGVTGLDLLLEAGLDLPILRRLGFGRCRLTVAVPDPSPVRSLTDLAGARIATGHPRSTRHFLAQLGLTVEIVPVSGAVEVAPRLGLAEAIADLVASGSTLAVNGLRAVADLLESQAVLVAHPAVARHAPETLTTLETMLGAVLAARGRKYLMLNAPAERLSELRALLPALTAPSVIPLAHEGMVALHSVVDADEVWRLLPRLQASGASGILVVPIEKLLP
jgi:ATP phosphoribosyltransferase